MEVVRLATKRINVRLLDPHPAQSASEIDFAVARFNSQGTLDTTFGPDGTGIVLTDFHGGKDYAWGGLALQADGRIVVVGEANSNQIGLARYMP